jgi:hypothetical protein
VRIYEAPIFFITFIGRNGWDTEKSGLAKNWLQQI